MDTKICTICSIEKPATFEYFYKSKYGKGGIDSRCKECHAIKAKKYYQENQEKMKEYSREYREENPEKVKRLMEKYRVENKEKIKSDFNKWYHANREYVLQRSKERRVENPEKYKQMIKDRRGKQSDYSKEYGKANREKLNKKLKKWRMENPGLNAKYRQDRRHRQKDSINIYSVDVWEETLRQFEYKCSYCNKEVDKLTQDHIVPVSKGGGYLRSNIVPACKSCNSSKGNKDMITWYREQDYFIEGNLEKIKEWAGITGDFQQISIL